MDMKYVILRTPSRATTGKRGLPIAETTAVTTPVHPKVEVGDIAPARAANLARKKGIIAAAPAMPMKLIAPVDGNTLAGPAAHGPTCPLCQTSCRL